MASKPPKRKKLRLRKPIRQALTLIVTVAVAVGIFFGVKALSNAFSTPAPAPVTDNNDPGTQEPVKEKKDFQLRKVSPGETVATVMIDPGHGAYDAGNIGPDGQLEKDINVRISNLVVKYLKEINPRLNVIVLRDDDSVPWADNEIDDLMYRTSVQEEQGVDYFISLHCNAFDDPSVAGTTAYVNKDDPIAHAMADRLLKDTNAVGWTATADVITTDTHPLQVVSWSKTHAMLIEMAYMTNPDDYALLNDEDSVDLFAKALAQSISDYIMENPDNPAYPEVWDTEYHKKLEEFQSSVITQIEGPSQSTGEQTPAEAAPEGEAVPETPAADQAAEPVQ